MGFVRGVGFALITYGFLSLFFIRKGSDYIVTRGDGLLGALTGFGISFTIVMMILGCTSRILFCSGGRKCTEKTNSLRSALIPLAIPIEVMVGYCYCSKLLHNIENLKKMEMYSGETIISIITALCQYMVPIVALMFEIPGVSVRKSKAYIVLFVIFGGFVYFKCCSNPEIADLYSPCGMFNRLGIYGKILSYSKVIIVPIITYEITMSAIQRKKVVVPPVKKVKRS